ncbi:MAG: serine hydrolase, partial [Armatimonadetes bacterium]|nr:serine hydrolase [Armatimonadota bacterium]
MKTVTATFTFLFAWVFMGMANSQPKTVFPGAKWQEATPESQGVDSAKLKAAVAHVDEKFGADGAKQLVIIRNGYLIWKGPNVDAYHKIFSCTKVFTSTVFGLLSDDGKCSVDDLAVKHLPALDEQYPLYAKIKLRDL